MERCRSLEYALQKRLKRPDDFAAYAAYLNDLYDLLNERRKRLDLWDKKAEVRRASDMLQKAGARRQATV